MRNIKFRMWAELEDGETGKLTHGMLDHDCLLDWELKDLLDDNNGKDKLMLWTGLVDRDGIEIYEGDFIKDGDIISLIEWDNRGCGFYSPINQTKNAWVNCEVVGNKFTHPELYDEQK